VQWLAEICVKRPVFAIMLIMAMVVAGLASYLQLGIDRFPRMDLPSIYVRTTLPGAAPEEMESEVTQRLEDAVATVEGIDELRSISSESSSLLLLTFHIDRDIDAAAQDVRDAISSVMNLLPPGVDPPTIRKQDTDASPIMSLAVSGHRDSRELYVFADRYVKNVIESAPGVGQVTISGASDRAVQVNLEASRLAAYKLSIMQVREALERQNAEIPGGRIDAGHRELSLRTQGRFAHPREFPDLVVATVNGHAVRLRDLGEVADDTKEVRTLARLDGTPAVVLQVQRQSGANTVEVIKAIKERLVRSRELLPADVNVDIIQDQSRYINAAMHEIQVHLIVGSVLASLVVLLFMRSWRSTLIAAVAIPASIIATFTMMRILDFTMNNMTMLALVLMVGVVIDDAIVVLENVFHAIEEKRMPPMKAAIEGTREIGLAVLATTLSLVIVFLPVSSLSSVTGRMLYQFGITASVAILVSMVVSFSLTPMMCSRFLKPVKTSGGKATSRGGFYHWIEVGYVFCLRQSMRFRWAVLAVSLTVIALNWPLYQMVQQDYVPTNVDESEFEARITAPEGASVASMDQTMRAVEKEVSAIDGVLNCLTTVGGRGTGSVNSGEIYVRLEDIEKRTFSLGRLWKETLNGQPLAALEGNYSQRDKMNEVRARLKKFTDLRCSIRNLTSLRSGAPVDIDFSLTGPDMMTLYHFSQDLSRKIVGGPGRPQAIAEVSGDGPIEITTEAPHRLSTDDSVLVSRVEGNTAANGEFQITVTSERTFTLNDATSNGQFVPSADAAVQPILPAIPGIVDVDTTLKLEKPEVLVEIDRERAASLGIDVQEIAETLRIAVGGDDRVSRYRDRAMDDAYDVELRLVGIDRSNREAISQLYVRAKPTAEELVRGRSELIRSAAAGSQALTRLDNVVRFHSNYNAARIDRLDRQRMVAVRANITGDYALGDRIEAVRAAAEELGYPPGVGSRVLGRGRELERTISDFGWTFILSFVFMYIILAAQFEHLVHPLTILFSLPLAVPFGLLSLWVGGETLNLYSALGILVLFGVVKKNSILQVDHTNQLRAAGMNRYDAIMQANRDRLRPILMTTIAFVAGMLPLLIGTGPGAEERRSIAVLACGGQTVSLLLTLLATPVIYSLFDDLAVLLGHRSKQQEADHTRHEPKHVAETKVEIPVAAVP
jgi:multidrug efflux pump subunit AcrB